MIRARRDTGFTLLEVMVAVAILGISLTAIFSSEAGAIRMASRSGKMGMAALLARCKMGEIEEQVAKEGLPAVYDTGSDACCEGAELDGFSCDWEINPVVLPDAMFGGGEEGEEDEEGGGPPPGGGINVPLGAATMSQEDLLTGGADLGGLASTALNFVYPVLKPSFEEQIRRATVTVKWREGTGDHSFDVTQYLVANQGVALDLGDEEEQSGSTGSTGSTGNSTGLGSSILPGFGR